jgi:tyrosyl-tRNA synthetase
MLDRDAVASRLAGAGISFTEFSYVLLQSLDYLELYRRHDVRLQVGGSDQWGNITAGIDLVRRVEGVGVHALTTPLLAKSDGTKFGKTEGGTIWLDPELTSPYAFYQYWVNAEDADVSNLLRTFSFRGREEIESLEGTTVESPAQRVGQRALADELTTLVHGAEQTARVVAASAALFGRGALTELDGPTLTAALREAPNAEVFSSALPTIVDLFVATGLCASRGEARRTVGEGGAYLNNQRVSDPEALPTTADFLADGWLVLRKGKRTFAGVHVAAV